MIHLSKILCPTDYSSTSDNAVRYAVEFARKVGAHIRFIHIQTAANPVTKGTTLQDGSIIDQIEEDDVLPESFSSILMAEKQKGLSADIRVLKGEASKVITDQAKSWGADLIIMGSHGRSGLHRLIMGSVAEDVFRSSDIPVLLVKQDAATKIVSE